MGNLFANISNYLMRHLWVYLILMVSLLGVFYMGFKNLELDENIYSIFPQGEKFQAFNKILKDNKLNRQVFFSIPVNERSTDELKKELERVSAELEQNTEGLLTDFTVLRGDQEDVLIDYVYDHLALLLDSNDYVQMDRELQPDQIEKTVGTVNERLSSMSSLFMRKFLSKDPFGFGLKKLAELNPRPDSAMTRVEDGILFSEDQTKALFTANLDFELSDNHKNEQLNKYLEKNAKRLGLDYFGPFQISYVNSKQVKHDTFITLTVSVGLILLLLIVYYRSILTPLYFILPALFSAFAGLGIVGFIHPGISAISVATSAVLLGIVLDYSFHFFTHFKDSGNLLETVKGLTFPMLVGSFTTVAAFAALLFTDSVLLQNFGLIALCTLGAASLFTLILLPPIVYYTRFRLKQGANRAPKRFSKIIVRTSIFGLLILTVVFLWNIHGVSFDGDMNNLSYHPDELAKKEEAFTGINPREDKKLNIFAFGSTREELYETNYVLYQKLLSYREKKGLDELVSIAPYTIPESIAVSKVKTWDAFWSTRVEVTYEELKESSGKFDFSEGAFVPFYKWVEQQTPVRSDTATLHKLGMDPLLYEGDGWNAVSSIVIDRDQVDDFKTYIHGDPNVFVFDIAEMTNALIAVVQDDFNYLLLFSSLLVFISLLIVYGRLELALFAFFPMAVSWVWILGIASLFNIEFNFVNIIVATFIFGLGDDFSIFVTDGLQQEYARGSNSLKSYSSAIVLSGLTTIIGTGALYFADHPAIHSIAVISVVGIGCILLITLLLQPSIYRFFITNRTRRKRSPITISGLVYSIFLYTYFLTGCLILNVVLLILFILPIKKSIKRRFLNYCVSKLAWSTLYLGFHVNKEVINKERLDFDRPSIIIANHSSFLDILLMIALNPKVVIMVKRWVYNSPFFGAFIRYAGYLYIAEGTEYNLDMIRERVEEGYSIVIFPEGTRSRDGKIQRFHKGAFHLAKELQLEIQPILIVGAHYVNPKNDIIIKSGMLSLWAMERILPGDPIYNERLGLVSKDIRGRMKAEYLIARSELENTKILRNRVLYNYLYKGPVLEWYVRVKWMFEKENFSEYDVLIGNRKKVYDVGCGYGYLSYYLHYRNEERQIIGVDYDREKVAIAEHGYDKTDQLHFKTGDLRELTMNEPDAIFYNDVLHYLSKEDQQEVLERSVEHLNPGGMIIIRDGVTDIGDKHKVTERSERYSTRIFGFNKVSGPLSFFSSADIFKFAEAHQLTCEMIEQSSKTSNVLFVLRKNS